MPDNMIPNEVSEWYQRNEKRVFTLRELMALLDQMQMSMGATRMEIDYMDDKYADDPAYVWKPPHIDLSPTVLDLLDVVDTFVEQWRSKEPFDPIKLRSLYQRYAEARETMGLPSLEME